MWREQWTKSVCSRRWSTCRSAPCGIHYRRGISCEDSENRSKDQEVSSACRPVCFFLLPVPASCRSTNEQVDVWLWLQHHLLSDEETRLRCVLLRSFLQPHFRAAAAAGRRLPSSAKGNADTVPSVPSIKRALCDYSRKPQVMCCAGNIWPDFGSSHMQLPVLFVIFTMQQHGSRQVTSYPGV